jgi:hypothetical protein
MDPDVSPLGDEAAGISLEEHLTIVRIGGELRTRLLATLEGAGWQLVGSDDLPSPDPAFLILDPLDDLDQQLPVSRQAAALADDGLAEVLAEASAVSAELDHSERLRAELDGLADLVALELVNARHMDDSTERLARIAEGATGLGFDQCAPDILSWVAEIAARTATPDPTATELIARRGQITGELTNGAGSTERAPDILAAHERRHDLRSLSVELEGMLERGLTAESRQMIESAHTERGRTEDAGGRKGGAASREALDAEVAALARFGYASFLDYQISTSTRAVGDHAETTLRRVRAEIDQADADLVAAGQAARATQAELQAELATVDEAIAALAGNRAIEGILARPPVFEQMRDQLAQASDSVRATGTTCSDRLTELQPTVDARTQEAARAEGEVEGLEIARRELALAWEVAAAAVADAETALNELIVSLVADGPVAIDADVAWLPADRIAAILEAAAASGPVVWCTDRTDLSSSRALAEPARWWQFRRRSRHGALTA